MVGTKEKRRVLKAGVKRIVHVHAKTIQANIADGTEKPMVMVRDCATPEQFILCRAVTILGRCRLAPHFDRPIPGTDGRGVCYVVTDAKLILTGVE